MSSNAYNHYLGLEGYGNYKILFENDEVEVSVAEAAKHKNLVKVIRWKNVKKGKKRIAVFDEAEQLCSLPSSRSFQRPCRYFANKTEFSLASNYSPDAKSIEKLAQELFIEREDGLEVMHPLEIVRLAALFLETLDTLHTIGVCHGNINPKSILCIDDNRNHDSSANTLFSSTKHYKLVDFVPPAIRYSFLNATLPHSDYSAPQPDVKSSLSILADDLWSVGTTLLKLAIDVKLSDLRRKLREKFLIQEINFKAAVINHLTPERLQQWNAQSPWIRKVIEKCLVVDPMRRPTVQFLLNDTSTQSVRHILHYIPIDAVESEEEIGKDKKQNSRKRSISMSSSDDVNDEETVEQVDERRFRSFLNKYDPRPDTSKSLSEPVINIETEVIDRKRAKERQQRERKAEMINLEVKDDLNKLERYLKRDKDNYGKPMPDEFDNFWKLLKQVDNNWRCLPMTITTGADHTEEFDEREGVKETEVRVYTYVMGLKVEKLQKYKEGVEYFLFEGALMDFLIAQAKLLNAEQLMGYFQTIKSSLEAKDEEDNSNDETIQQMDEEGENDQGDPGSEANVTEDSQEQQNKKKRTA